MAVKKKSQTSDVTNASYCMSTAVSDFVLMCSCVFGEKILHIFPCLIPMFRCLENVPGKLE